MQNPPLRGGVVRWMVGVVLNVQSTSAACAKKVVFGARWTTLWARFCDAGGVPSGVVAPMLQESAEVIRVCLRHTRMQS